MRAFKAIAVVSACVIIGMVAGIVVAGLFLPADPTGRGAPGDGILLFMGMGYGALLSLIPAVLLVRRIFQRRTRANVQP